MLWLKVVHPAAWQSHHLINFGRVNDEHAAVLALTQFQMTLKAAVPYQHVEDMPRWDGTVSTSRSYQKSQTQHLSNL
jgi:hypothetical protein